VGSMDGSVTIIQVNYAAFPVFELETYIATPYSIRI
jgi:hypothetical protein